MAEVATTRHARMLPVCRCADEHQPLSSFEAERGHARPYRRRKPLIDEMLRMSAVITIHATYTFTPPPSSCQTFNVAWCQRKRWQDCCSNNGPPTAAWGTPQETSHHARRRMFRRHVRRRTLYQPNRQMRRAGTSEAGFRHNQPLREGRSAKPVVNVCPSPASAAIVDTVIHHAHYANRPCRQPRDAATSRVAQQRYQ